MIQVVVENLNIDAKHIFIVQKEHHEKLHWKYDCDLKQLRDLGQIKFSWAFVFKLGVKDDGPKTDKSVPGGDSDAAPQDGERIPLEAWQLANRLWELDFHIEHEFTLLYDMLILLVGLPYKKLCEEANDQKIKMRLCKTKGMAEYMEEMTELYAVGDPETGSPFTSAMSFSRSSARMLKYSFASFFCFGQTCMSRMSNGSNRTRRACGATVALMAIIDLMTD